MPNDEARRSDDAPHVDVIVIGGGLGGLTAAATAARAGADVTLIEARSALGGRGRTREAHGHLFNEGAHALYDGGIGVEVLAELGITPRGGHPPTAGWARSGGAIKRIPSGPLEAMRTTLVGPRAKAELARLLLKPERLLDREMAGLSAQEWIDRNVTTRGATALLAQTTRVGTYCGALDQIDAEAALRQVVQALRSGVLYLDGGWQQLIDGLRTVAVSAGVTVRSERRVHAVRHHDGAVSVTTADGILRAGAVVLAAGGPTQSASLLSGASPTVERWAATERPCHVAALDLAFRALPNPRQRFVIDLDLPIYFSAHTPTAALAPGTPDQAPGEVVHLLWYGDEGLGEDGRDPRPELEALLDQAQPGWRDQVIAEQYGRARMATAGRPEPGRGLRGRPGVAVPDLPGVFVTGDWVGPDGMLGEAVLASGRAAGRAAAARVGAGLAAPLTARSTIQPTVDA